ncbi:acyltransferase [Paraburkholderia sp.]|jgi:peptidoglycan/LPS O-acetylase OafA/YrhL|uniref:acyltransferase family protein n=1 Tax=Paraburkholderia sp. TaxID=1926495 RepID=UPI002F3E9498
MSHRIEALTGLRCVAVMMVVVAHAEHMIAGGYSGWLAPLRLFANGGLGVLIFFVLSGFLITDLLQSEWRRTGALRFGAFYMRRALRIWPAFYAYLLTIAAFSACGLIDVDYHQLGYAALHLWNYSELLGLGPTNSVHPEGVWYLGHFWTLALEEQFYWFWPPLLLLILHRKDTRLLMALILVVPLIRMSSYFATPSLRAQLEMMLHTGIDPILMGCYVALNKERFARILNERPGSSLILTALAAVLFFVIPVIEHKAGGYWVASYGRTVESALAGIVIGALYLKRDFWLARMLQMRAFVFVGTISFSLYLWQQLFLDTTSPVALRFPWCVLAAFAAASLSYGLIELPFLRLKDRLSSRARRRTTESNAGEANERGMSMGVKAVEAGE